MPLSHVAPRPVILLETDMCTDVDDVGALAMLHALADNGECEIAAVCYNASHPHGAGAIAAINTWYGRGDLPIGVYKGTHPDTTDPSAYCEALHIGFPNSVGLTASMPDALAVYRTTLQAAADRSVVLISIGFTQTLSLLVDLERELLRRKVRELVLMGLPCNDGWNLSAHDMESYTRNVIEYWPGRIVITAHGKTVITGQRLAETPIENPVRAAYRHYYKGEEGRGRSSWDQVAVLYGVRGLNSCFTEECEGLCRLRGGWEWCLGPDRIQVLPRSDINFAGIIETLMIQLPQKSCS